MEGKRVERIPDAFVAEKSHRYECVLVAADGEDSAVLRREGDGPIELAITAGGSEYRMPPGSPLIRMFLESDRFERICYEGNIDGEPVVFWICLRGKRREIRMKHRGSAVRAA